eukprot:gene29026-35036_t
MWEAAARAAELEGDAKSTIKSELKNDYQMYIHIGPSKTGSSYIQDVLASLKDDFPSQGFCWPAEGQGKVFSRYVRAFDLEQYDLQEQLRRNIENCIHKQLNIIISSEFFHWASNLTAIESFFKPYQPTIIAYRR